MNLNNLTHLTLEKPYTCITPSGPLHIFVVGVGGTGGHLAPQLARMMWLERENGRNIKMTFVDPDLIEEKNIGRQNFCPASIGQNKGLDLALRFNAAYGLDIGAIPFKFDPLMIEKAKAKAGFDHRNGTTLIIDCVDNPDARQMIDQVPLGRESWLISCGNAASNGHVMIGNCKEPQPHNLDAFGFCHYLPSPYRLEPELLTAQPADGRPEGHHTADNSTALSLMSCAELTAAGLQERMVNVHAAAHAAVMVDDFLKGGLTYFDVRFNISPPAVQRKDVTGSNLGGWLGEMGGSSRV